jgi:hypothetical protein
MAGNNTKMLSLIVVGALFLVATGIVLAVGSQVTDDVRGGLLLSERVTNQTITFTNNTVHVISGSQVTSIVSLSNFTQVYNSGNFTLTAGQDASSLLIVIRCGTCTGVGATLNVTYDVNSKTLASLAANNATSGLGSFQLESVGTTLGAAIIVVIVFSVLSVFAMRSRGGGRGRGE